MPFAPRRVEATYTGGATPGEVRGRCPVAQGPFTRSMGGTHQKSHRTRGLTQFSPVLLEKIGYLSRAHSFCSFAFDALRLLRIFLAKRRFCILMVRLFGCLVD